jgi:hypothetical protein
MARGLFVFPQAYGNGPEVRLDPKLSPRLVGQVLLGLQFEEPFLRKSVGSL